MPNCPSVCAHAAASFLYMFAYLASADESDAYLGSSRNNIIISFFYLSAPFGCNMLCRPGGRPLDVTLCLRVPVVT